MVITELFLAVSILALWPVPTEAAFVPIFANLTLVHRSFDKALVGERVQG